MSILSYISDPLPLVIIGGRSGIGKTSIIDVLLNDHPETFAQPKSYTTRKKRNNNDRYQFVSKTRIHEMFENGELLNLDSVFGEYYGIDKNAVSRIKKLGKIPIKEIHPVNFHKFRRRGLNCISVLIENRHFSNESTPFVERENREEQISESSYESDICLNVAGLTPNEAASFLIKKLLAFRLHLFQFERPSIIDESNRVGYDQVADEFRDELRITTKNFHDASTGFWRERLNYLQHSKSALDILELGPGNGWLFETVDPKNHNIYGVEISTRMDPTYCKSLFHCSARNIPVRSEYFDLVVGSLSDPLLVPEVFVEIERVLKPDGRFIVTVPSSEWSRGLDEREGVYKATFKKRSGELVTVFSFCNTLFVHWLVQPFSKLTLVESIGLYLNKNYEGPISEAISISVRNAEKPLRDMPIVLGLTLVKNL